MTLRNLAEQNSNSTEAGGDGTSDSELGLGMAKTANFFVPCTSLIIVGRECNSSMIA
jgi:hypothetical protein